MYSLYIRATTDLKFIYGNEKLTPLSINQKFLYYTKLKTNWAHILCRRSCFVCRSGQMKNILVYARI